MNMLKRLKEKTLVQFGALIINYQTLIWLKPILVAYISKSSTELLPINALMEMERVHIKVMLI
jgi:hypothetical protein